VSGNEIYETNVKIQMARLKKKHNEDILSEIKISPVVEKNLKLLK
jgi:hypothetical protein